MTASPKRAGRSLGADGALKDAEWLVPDERPLAVLVNGAHFAVMMVTPQDLEDFAAGFAITEGLARDISDIGGLALIEAGDGWAVNLRLPPERAAAVKGRERTLAGRAGCGLCGAQTVEAALPPPRKVTGRIPAAEALRAALAAFPEAQSLNRENRSTHGAAFCDAAGRIVLIREDVGRHNALDKLAGAMARAGVAVEGGFVLLSSRISVEMAQKAAMMNAPCLVSLSAPTALALETAERAGLPVVCRAANGAFMIFDKD